MTIVFTDVVGGCSAAFHRERDFIAAVQADLTFFRSTAEQNGGHYVKSTGDGVLLWFASCTEAIRWARIAQHHIDVKKKALNSKGLLHRIGIHVGEVVFIVDDILGNAANFAKRVESAGHRNTVTLSNTAWEMASPASQDPPRRLLPTYLKGFPSSFELYEYPSSISWLVDESRYQGPNDIAAAYAVPQVQPARPRIGRYLVIAIIFAVMSAYALNRGWVNTAVAKAYVELFSPAPKPPPGPSPRPRPDRPGDDDPKAPSDSNEGHDIVHPPAPKPDPVISVPEPPARPVMTIRDETLADYLSRYDYNGALAEVERSSSAFQIGRVRDQLSALIDFQNAVSTSIQNFTAADAPLRVGARSYFTDLGQLQRQIGDGPPEPVSIFDSGDSALSNSEIAGIARALRSAPSVSANDQKAIARGLPLFTRVNP